MTSTWHRINVTDAESRRGACSVCGPDVPLRRRVRRGAVEWSCMTKHRSYDVNRTPRGIVRKFIKSYRRVNTGVCAECGFVALHLSQIDVHHIDGDHGNNDPVNLVSWCANCHRLWHTLGAEGFAAARRARFASESEHEGLRVAA